MSHLNSPTLGSEFRVPYMKRDGAATGAVFVSRSGDCRLLPDGWLSFAELTDEDRLLTLHYSVGKVRVRGHQLKELFEDVCRRRLGMLCECGSPAPAEGLWVNSFEWQFPVEQTEDLASYVPDQLRV